MIEQKGKVYLLVGMPGTGKSSLRSKLASSSFFSKNGILIQDISPDAEGSWILGKDKETIKKIRERPKNSYSPLYYQEVCKTLENAKKNLILFIADFGGIPNPNEENIFSDKEKILEIADGYILLNAVDDKWKDSLLEKKHLIKYDMPTSRLTNIEFDLFLDEIKTKIEIEFHKLILNNDLSENYKKQINSIIFDQQMIPVNVQDYLDSSNNIESNTLSKISPLENSTSKKYCLFGKGPIYLYTHLIQNLSYCAYFDPKSIDPIIDLPIANRFDISRDRDYKYQIIDLIYNRVNNSIKADSKENFITPFDIPLIDKQKIIEYGTDKLFLEGKLPIWGYMDLFLQLKNVVDIRGIYNKRDDRVIWI